MLIYKCFRFQVDKLIIVHGLLGAFNLRTRTQLSINIKNKSDLHIQISMAINQACFVWLSGIDTGTKQMCLVCEGCIMLAPTPDTILGRLVSATTRCPGTEH